MNSSAPHYRRQNESALRSTTTIRQTESALYQEFATSFGDKLKFCIWAAGFDVAAPQLYADQTSRIFWDDTRLDFVTLGFGRPRRFRSSQPAQYIYLRDIPDTYDAWLTHITDNVLRHHIDRTARRLERSGVNVRGRDVNIATEVIAFLASSRRRALVGGLPNEGLYDVLSESPSLRPWVGYPRLTGPGRVRNQILQRTGLVFKTKTGSQGQRVDYRTVWGDSSIEQLFRKWRMSSNDELPATGQWRLKPHTQAVLALQRHGSESAVLAESARSSSWDPAEFTLI